MTDNVKPQAPAWKPKADALIKTYISKDQPQKDEAIAFANNAYEDDAAKYVAKALSPQVLPPAPSWAKAKLSPRPAASAVPAPSSSPPSSAPVAEAPTDSAILSPVQQSRSAGAAVVATPKAVRPEVVAKLIAAAKAKLEAKPIEPAVEPEVKGLLAQHMAILAGLKASPEPAPLEPDEAEDEPSVEPEPAPQKPDEPSVAEDEPPSEAAADEVLVFKCLRLKGALAKLTPTPSLTVRVAGLLWRVCGSNPEKGYAVLAGWLHDGAGEAWAKAKDTSGAGATSEEELYRLAQAKGWRYLIITNLNALAKTTEDVERALIRVGAPVYQSSGALVRATAVMVDAAKGKKTRIARMIQISPPFLKTELSRYVDFITMTKDGRKASAVPGDVVNGLLGGYGKWKFPVLTGVICSPTLRRKGTVLAVEGYDPETELLVMGPLPPMAPIRDTRADAELAAGHLRRLLLEFPFVDEASRSVVVSAILTTVCRAALGCVPMHASTAPTAGTGKSYLWDVAAVIAHGDTMPVIAAGREGGELAKKLDAQVWAGFSMLSIDNVSMPLGGDELCQIIERPSYTLRVLGQSKTVERRNTWSVFATGNNLRLRDDVTRRALLSRLDAGMERPELRVFQGNPLEEVGANRGLYLWSALTIVRAYQAAGMPNRPNRIGDPFAEWNDLIRGALLWLGFADPVETMEAIRASDPSRLARGAMFAAIGNAYGFGPVAGRSAREMIDDAKAGFLTKAAPAGKVRNSIPASAPLAGDLKDAITNYTGDKLDGKWLGNKFGVDKGSIAGGLRLHSDYNTHKKINLWYVEKINP